LPTVATGFTASVPLSELLLAGSAPAVFAGAVNITVVVGDSIQATVTRDGTIGFTAPTTDDIGFTVSRA
jgi:hypothetical protein